MAFKRIAAWQVPDFLKQASAEVVRLHSLPDRFLGRALRDLGRSARAELGSPYDIAGTTGYGSAILWHVLPGLARGLGETSLNSDERWGANMLPEGRSDLRRYVGNCLANSEITARLRRMGLWGAAPSCHVIEHAFCNGNPITSGLDRVAPPHAESKDWIAVHMREISGFRFGHSRFDAWSPEFNLHQGQSGESVDPDREGPEEGPESMTQRPAL